MLGYSLLFWQKRPPVAIRTVLLRAIRRYRICMLFEDATRRYRGLIQQPFWAHRALHQVATAIGAISAELIVSAICTECALEGTDASTIRRWRKIAVAALTIWA